jgi:hypothetical protein
VGVAVVSGLLMTGGAYIAAGGLTYGFAATWAAFTALSAVSKALSPKPSMGSGVSGTTVMIRQATPSRKIAYGRTRIGGAICYLDGTGTDNEYLHLVMAVSSRKIDAYEAMYFNDEKVWENGSFLSDWGNFATLATYDGTQTTADANLVAASSGWSSTAVGFGTAYAYVRLQQSAEKFPRGLPNISFVVRGKPVYDPQKDSTSSYYDASLGVNTHRLNDETTWEWTQNPALIIADYMADARYSIGEDYNALNPSYLDEAQSLADSQIALDGGGTQARYAMDAVVDTANTPRDNLESMLTSLNGRLVPSGGQYYLSGAAYQTPTVTIDESILVDAISVQTKNSVRNLFNAVKGVYLSSEENYIATDYPSVISASYSVEDGEPLYLELPLPFTTNNVRAQQLAKMSLLESRQQVSVTLPMNMSGLLLKAGDTFKLSNDRFGWTEKVFQVLDYDLSLGSDGMLVVNVSAIETDSTIYDWTTTDQTAFTPATPINLPVPAGQISYNDIVHNSDVLSSSQVLLVGYHYHIDTAGQTFTLPTANVGESIGISVEDFADTELDPNGAKILGETDVRVVNKEDIGFDMLYTGTAYGWIIK